MSSCRCIADNVTPFEYNTYIHKIQNLKQKIIDVQNLLETPPFIILHGVQTIKSNFMRLDWKEHIFYILNKCKINPTWILDIINETNVNNPNQVKIQFATPYVKIIVSQTINEFITKNLLHNMHIDM